MKTDAMPTKAEFKFNCPICSQRILVAAEWYGLGISCPSCQHRISIPKPFDDGAGTTLAASQNQTKPTIRIELPTKPRPDAAGLNGELAAHSTSAAMTPTSVTANEPWPEMVERLEKGALVEPAVLATALFRELTNVRRRLEEVEKRLAERQPHAGANGADTKFAPLAGN